MRQSFKLQEKQEQKKEEDPNAIDTKCCIICDKVLAGAYGRSMVQDVEVWTCSKTCEKLFQEDRNENR